jgi:hypothetical protein
LPEPTDRVEPEPRVELLGPIGVIGDEEDDLGSHASRFSNDTADDRSCDAAPAEALQRMHVVDLGDAVVRVELAEARQDAVDANGEEPRTRDIREHPTNGGVRLGGLPRHPAVAREIGLEHQRVDLVERALLHGHARSVIEVPPLHHEHQVVDLPVLSSERRGQSRTEIVVEDDDLAMRRVLEQPVRLGDQLLRGRVDGVVDPKEVAVPVRREVVVEQSGPEPGDLDASAGGLLTPAEMRLDPIAIPGHAG